MQRNIENKTKFLRCDLALLSHHYDIRIDAAREVPHTQPSGDGGFNPNVWHIERLKQRVSYQAPRRGKPGQDEGPLWKLDLTEVETSAQDTLEVTRDMEIEFEMIPR